MKPITFDSMDLIPPLNQALVESNYKTPTPIQAKTIPAALQGQDILGCAQTGTGKTAAFALPTLDFLGRDSQKAQPGRPRALVLSPTRELAIQIGDSFKKYGQHLKIRQTLVYGGVSQKKQVAAMRRGVHVLIATPGRLVDLINQKYISLKDVEVFILDEADRMMDMGFLPQLKKIIGMLPRERQSLFFSATMPPKIRDLAKDLLFNPKTINVTPKTPSVAGIDQQIYMLSKKQKLPKLHEFLRDPGMERAIIFTKTKRGANLLSRKLDEAGFPTNAIHGNKSQAARQRTLEDFRRNRIQILVATDVASRGIDIDGITHVFNYDMPMEPESYVHRIGRTGRAGANGIAISFCTAEDRQILKAVERLVKTELTIIYDESAERNRKDDSRRNKNAKPKRWSKNGKSRNSKGRTGSPGKAKSSRRPTGSRKSNAVGKTEAVESSRSSGKSGGSDKPRTSGKPKASAKTGASAKAGTSGKSKASTKARASGKTRVNSKSKTADRSKGATSKRTSKTSTRKTGRKKSSKNQNSRRYTAV